MQQNSRRSLPARFAWAGLGAVSIGFHIWLIFSGLVPNLISRPLHMALALPWIFIFLSKSTFGRRTGAVMAGLGIICCLYIVHNHVALSDQYGSLEGAMQMWMAVALILIVLEIARRAIGWPLPLMTALALAYGLLGSYLPGEFGHPGLPVESFLGTMVIAEGGLWGSLTGVSVSIVAVFVIMGAVLNAGEAGQGFMNLAASVLLLFDSRLTLDFARTIERLEKVTLTAGRQIAVIASIILCASLIISVLGQTGLGVKVTSLILSAGGDRLWPALLLTALACLLLGMEVPTTAAYVICISVAGPALEKLGLDALTTNLFVFWFALLSTITPPVCGAVFIAAGMVNENWLKVAAAAMALGVGLYVIPFAMIANPPLIALAHAPVSALAVFVKLAIGLSALSYGIISRRQLGGRLTLIALGLTMVFIRLPVVAVSQ